jgi:D-threonate/D-erythronate kinase
MILVLADDFSGAAEIAGIAYGAGFETNLITESDHIPEDGDVLVFDTSTRSVSNKQARQKIETIISRISELDIDWIYKKIDSVLRGHVITEINQILDQIQFKQSIMIPANPSKNRIIRDGIYLVDGEPINQTDFAHDPQFPARSARILELLAAENNKYPVHAIKPNNPVFDGAINVCEIGNEIDLKFWCNQITRDVLPAGGSAFFAELIRLRTVDSGPAEHISKSNKKIIKLYVIGSTAGLQNLEVTGSQFPCKIESMNDITSECRDLWQNEIELHLRRGKSVAMWISGARSTNKEIPEKLREIMADIVQDLLPAYNISNLIISGGDTADSIVQRLAWHHFKPVGEYDTGVVSLKILDHDGPLLTVKPGSYNWPGELIN